MSNGLHFRPTAKHICFILRSNHDALHPIVSLEDSRRHLLPIPRDPACSLTTPRAVRAPVSLHSSNRNLILPLRTQSPPTLEPRQVAQRVHKCHRRGRSCHFMTSPYGFLLIWRILRGTRHLAQVRPSAIRHTYIHHKQQYRQRKTTRASSSSYCVER